MSDYVLVKNLNYSDGNNKILKNISFELKKGDFATFVCNEASGKTTLCKILSGIIQVDSNIKICNYSLTSKNNRSLRKQISFVSENTNNIFLGDTVNDDIYFYLKNVGLKKDQIADCLNKYSKSLGIDKFLNNSSNRISQGQKQLVAFFLAISANPKILIIDNAFSMIDQELKKKIFLLLRQYNKKGMTILNFTNDAEECFNGNKSLLFVNGEIVLNCDTNNFFKDLKVFKEYNVKIPFIIELSKKLLYYKAIDSEYTNYKKLVDDIWK